MYIVKFFKKYKRHKELHIIYPVFLLHMFLQIFNKSSIQAIVREYLLLAHL